MRHVCATCLYHILVHVLQLSSFSATLWTLFFFLRNLSWGFYQPNKLRTFSNSSFYPTPISHCNETTLTHNYSEVSTGYFTAVF